MKTQEKAHFGYLKTLTPLNFIIENKFYLEKIVGKAAKVKPLISYICFLINFDPLLILTDPTPPHPI